MKNKATVLRTLFYITWLLLCFVIYWFFAKPIIPLLESFRYLELNTGDFAKWGFIKSMLLLIPTAISYLIGLYVITFVTTSHPEKKKTQYIGLSIIVIGLLFLIAFIGKIVSDFSNEGLLSNIGIPDVNIWAYFVLEVVAFACGTLGSLSSADSH